MRHINKRAKIFPPILTDRFPRRSRHSCSSPKGRRRDHIQQKVHFDISGQHLSSGSHSSPDSLSSDDSELLSDGQQVSALNNSARPYLPPSQAQNSQDEWSCLLDAEGTSDFVVNDFYFAQRNLIVEYVGGNYENMSSYHSGVSNFVDNSWADTASIDEKSGEAQEAELHNQYWEAICHLKNSQKEEAAASFLSILAHPIMCKFFAADFGIFISDDTNESVYKSRMHSDMAKIYFSANLAMIGLSMNSFPFYVQALSIRPDFKDLWFLCGLAAIKIRDWRSACFCFIRSGNEFRVIEALFLVHYLDQNFIDCTHYLEKIFLLSPQHELGHCIRTFISEKCHFWKVLHEKICSQSTLQITPSDEQRKKVLAFINRFMESSCCHKVNKVFS